jgi:hypothetical protein
VEVSSGLNKFKACTAFTENRDLHAAVPWRSSKSEDWSAQLFG